MQAQASDRNASKTLNEEKNQKSFTEIVDEQTFQRKKEKNLRKAQNLFTEPREALFVWQEYEIQPEI